MSSTPVRYQVLLTPLIQCVGALRVVLVMQTSEHFEMG